MKKSVVGITVAAAIAAVALVLATPVASAAEDSAAPRPLTLPDGASVPYHFIQLEAPERFDTELSKICSRSQPRAADANDEKKTRSEP